MQDDPKGSQQRQRYGAAKQQAEQQRIALQRQAWLKQSLARRRIEAARQNQQLHLKALASRFDAKLDAIRCCSFPPTSLPKHHAACVYIVKDLTRCP